MPFLGSDAKSAECQVFLMQMEVNAPMESKSSFAQRNKISLTEINLCNVLSVENNSLTFVSHHPKSLAESFCRPFGKSSHFACLFMQNEM